jgi:hypothetical protein
MTEVGTWKVNLPTPGLPTPEDHAGLWEYVGFEGIDMATLPGTGIGLS